MRVATPRRRTGFTLIELLVVIAIIAILIGLVSSAVMKFLTKGPVAQTRAEIGQLETAVASFTRDFSLSDRYPPSRFILCDRYSDYINIINGGGANGQLARDSLTYLQSMFPRLWKTAQAQKTVVDWNQNNKIDIALLEGDQCLVFFLGGCPTPPGQPFRCQGFGPQQTNPANFAAAGTRKGPYYEFDSGRLTLNIHKNATYYSYLDPYGQGAPYAYFSSYGKVNGYNPYLAGFKNSDCATLGVWPYAEFAGNANTPARYQYPNKFQIISAGLDGKFGAGTVMTQANPRVWTPSTAASGVDANGQDDQANFFGPILSASE